MYAMIQRHASSAVVLDGRAHAGHALGARLGALPGFVAFVLLEEPDGGWISVSLCEARETLTDAQRLLADWLEPRAARIPLRSGCMPRGAGSAAGTREGRER